MTDRYDPSGEAAIWQAAAELVTTLKRDDAPDASTWNAAIEQAARALDVEARGIRQRDGMYYRVITGSGTMRTVERPYAASTLAAGSVVERPRAGGYGAARSMLSAMSRISKYRYFPALRTASYLIV